MRYVPLLIIPFALYNAFAFLIFESPEAGFRTATMFSVPMMSGASFTLSVSAAIILMALFLLAFEVIKAARVGTGSVADHVLATVIFIAFLIEFLLVPQAATDTFLVLTAIALVDLICGFAVSIRTATRDISLEG
ncbi:MAG TPA: hypothetical protein VGA77_10060 [Propylenella sp.]